MAEGPEGVESDSERCDDDPGIAPQFHNHVDDAPPWLAVPDDGLPRYATTPAAREPRRGPS